MSEPTEIEIGIFKKAGRLFPDRSLLVIDQIGNDTRVIRNESPIFASKDLFSSIQFAKMSGYRKFVEQGKATPVNERTGKSLLEK